MGPVESTSEFRISALNWDKTLFFTVLLRSQSKTRVIIQWHVTVTLELGPTNHPPPPQNKLLSPIIPEHLQHSIKKQVVIKDK
jgi:hypothetical protein